MIESILASIANEKHLDFLNKALAKVSDNKGGDIPELKEQINAIRPYFEEDKYFVQAVKNSIKKIRTTFDGNEQERAMNYVNARKTRNHLIQRIEEAIGYRELAGGNFENYAIMAFSKIPAIRGEELILKIDYSKPFYLTTTNRGFKETDNVFRNRIISKARELVTKLMERGSYDAIDSDIKLLDQGTGVAMELHLACNKLGKKMGTGEHSNY